MLVRRSCPATHHFFLCFSACRPPSLKEQPPYGKDSRPSVLPLKSQMSTESLLTMETLKGLARLRSEYTTAGLLSPTPKRNDPTGFLSVENTAGDSVWTTLNKLVKYQPAPVLPLFTAKDVGVPDRRETLLEGQLVSGFLVGGEMRLCFPQVLNTILKTFHVTDINRAIQDLNIHMAPSGVEQLEVLKIAGILPFSAPSCGLITKSDAERLCNFLIRRPNLVYFGQQTTNGRYSRTSNRRPTRSPGPSAIPVAHECFGRAEGSFLTDLYFSPRSDCIECWECGELSTPEKFVTHCHRFLETKTCHWGFDSANWRDYVHLQRSLDSDAALQDSLKLVKSKFLQPTNAALSSHHSAKRKANEVSEGAVVPSLLILISFVLSRLFPMIKANRQSRKRPLHIGDLPHFQV